MHVSINKIEAMHSLCNHLAEPLILALCHRDQPCVGHPPHPKTSASFPDRSLLNLQAHKLKRLPVMTAPSAKQDCGDGGASYSVGLGLTEALWYGHQGGNSIETSGKDDKSFAPMMSGPSLKKTMDGGFIS